MIYWFYESMLKRQITELPEHVRFMISGEDMMDAPEQPDPYHIVVQRDIKTRGKNPA